MVDFSEIFKKTSNLTVMVIGDVMIDAYSIGKVSRISPEAPVPVVDVYEKENRLGGAANVAKNIKALGAKCVLCAVIGNDENSEEFLRLIEKNQIIGDALVLSDSRKTTVKHRVLSGSQQLLRLDEEDNRALNPEENNKLLQNIEEYIDKCDVILLQDYDKGVLNENNIELIIQKAKKRNIPIVADPKFKNFKLFKNISLLKPNLKEINNGFDVSITPKNEQSLIDGVALLRETMHIKNVLLTLSEYGVYFDFDGKHGFIPTEAKSIADVSGAGDTVISVAAVLYALDLEPHILAKIANLAGGIVCEKLGVVPIDKNELIAKAKNLVF